MTNILCFILSVVRGHYKVLAAGWRIEYSGQLMVGNSEHREQ